MIETIVAPTRSIDIAALRNEIPTHPNDAPCTSARDVTRIATERFRTCPYSAIRQVQCRFHEGVLVLSGQVPSFYMKQVAQELIRNLQPIEQISNRLNVPK
ncbi:hypothetical protein Pla52o_01260 [Novipirellula galeiformis]|uniref:BON domain protein n=1 Tax=Novipirellula galeiformis TaxID=2528004 RepID=A0A5C6CMW0_9BACT|nr:BON domain-containing protein [Novipirellula galeiformis]TWU26273.1 hypothetical protein Pla52o_01260 [Novipirellula galeiformis]